MANQRNIASQSNNNAGDEPSN